GIRDKLVTGVQTCALPIYHINIKTVSSDSKGRLFVAAKSSLGDSPSDPSNGALVSLLVRSSTGSWTRTTFGTVANDHTRPLVLLDQTHNRVYMFATAPVTGGTIYYKSTSM